jgi:hypothetical protein
MHKVIAKFAANTDLPTPPLPPVTAMIVANTASEKKGKT